MEPRGLADIFFHYDSEWSAQDLLKTSLRSKKNAFAALEECALLEIILAGDDSPLRGYAINDYMARVEVGGRDDLRTGEQMKDYFDYLHLTVCPKQGAVDIAMKVLYMRANSKQNL